MDEFRNKGSHMIELPLFDFELECAGKLGRHSLLAVLDAAEAIESDYECRALLVEVAHVMPADEQLVQRYREVAAKLSDYEREQAERALPGAAG